MEFMMLRIGETILIPEATPDGIVLASIYPSLPGVDHSTLRDAVFQDFEHIQHLRFDPVSACNVRCVFCHSDFSGAVRQLAPEAFRAAMRFSMPKLQNISVGCAYEPLMGKFFESYPSMMPRKHPAGVRARIITNGLLLHKKDISPWVEFGLEYIHVSVHSHLADVYERTMVGASMRQLCDNLRAVRLKFPDLRINMINVVCKENQVHIGDYCRWAFDEIGADRVDIYRAAFAGNRQAGYPATSYVERFSNEMSRSPALTDEEWATTVDEVSKFMGGPLRGNIHALGAAISTLILRRTEVVRDDQPLH